MSSSTASISTSAQPQPSRSPQPLLFITVGSTDFDALVQAVDELMPSLAGYSGIVQIGHGDYIPRNLPWFRFDSSLSAYYEHASLVIAHGGLATTMEVLRRQVPLVSVSNPDRYDNHQDDLLEIMARDGYLSWCRNLDGLAAAVNAATSQTLRRYETPACWIHKEIYRYLSQSAANR